MARHFFEFISPSEFRQNKKRSKRRIPPQTPPPPLATSEFKKKESAEVLRNPFPRKLFPQNFVRIVSDFLVGIAFKKGSNFVQNIPQSRDSTRYVKYLEKSFLIKNTHLSVF